MSDRIYTALAKAQGQFRTVECSGTNPHYCSKFATIADIMKMIRQPLASNGLCLVQLPETFDGMVSVTTEIYHSSGDSISCTLSSPTEKKRNPVHAVGSTISYLRRYGLSSLLCIATGEEEDDGEQPRQQQEQPRQQQEQPRQQQEQPRQQQWSKLNRQLRAMATERELSAQDLHAIAGVSSLKSLTASELKKLVDDVGMWSKVQFSEENLNLTHEIKKAPDKESLHALWSEFWGQWWSLTAVKRLQVFKAKESRKAELEGEKS